MWNEETGERELGRNGLPILRPANAPTKCETYAIRERLRPGQAEGACPKGHWKSEPDLTAGEEMVIDLYRAAKVTGGAMLTEGERSSAWLMMVFSRLAEVDALYEVKQKAEQSAAIMALINRG